MDRPRLVVLVSGSGSNLQAIVDATTDGTLTADIVAVVSNRTDAYGLERARQAGIETCALPRSADEARADYDVRLAQVVAEHRPDWIVLAGWMRLLTMNFLGCFPNRVVNLHPALPGELAGTHAIERAWEQAVAGERHHSGVMVHLVPDEGVDDGPVLATSTVPIDTSGTLEAFEAAIHRAEHRLLVDTLVSLTSDHRPPETT
jgi:phosphoribosylglycinamide formyltransferase 1